MAVPTWTVGQVLASADVNNWFVPLAAYKTSDTSRTNNTLAADPDLIVPVAANAVYAVSAYIPNSGAAPGTVDFKWLFTVPASATLPAHFLYNQTSGAGVAMSNNSVLSSTVTGTSVSATAVILEGTLTTAGTSGNLGFNWAQNVTSGTATVVKAGARFVLQRIG